MLIAAAGDMTHSLLASSALVFLFASCTTSAPEPKSTASSMPIVSSIDISRSVGQVGQKFKAQVSMHSPDLGEAEYRVGSLPPGLHFHQESMSIEGIPEADGFFSVTVSVRKKRGPGIHFSTPEGAWYSERLDIDIYKPVEDGSDSRPELAASEF